MENSVSLRQYRQCNCKYISTHTYVYISISIDRIITVNENDTCTDTYIQNDMHYNILNHCWCKKHVFDMRNKLYTLKKTK